MIDKNEFFRDVTLRICGSLVVEKWLHACFAFVAEHIPADQIYLQRYNRDRGVMRFVARANREGGEKMDLQVPLPEVAQKSIDDFDREWHARRLPKVVSYNKPMAHPLSRGLLQALGEPVSSCLALPLVVEGEFAGTLALLARGEDRFNEDHSRLYATLKEPLFVAMSNTLRHEEAVQLRDRLADDNRQLQKELLHISGDEIIGADFGLRNIMRQIRQVAPTQSPVLLTGETGVGKDVIANAIHLGSPRRDGPFIPVNCGAIPESLLDSELFGHEKGAFTGALSQKRGRFERADKGTILLDEIGEMPPDAQVRLLRVLQNREIERVGGSERIPVDIRIIAATNQNLEKMVEEGSFRKDLFFRLSVFPIVVPPLRERTSDIPALVQFFIERKAKELKIGGVPRLASGALDTLMSYGWPGNVRELENVIERAMILHQGEPLRFDELATSLVGVPAPPSLPETGGRPLDLDSVVAEHIQKALDRTGGKIHGPGGAGELLGVNPNTLRYRMQKLGIPFRK
jgi:transcriptional regulator with GAF, ATPase, and Fis domain